jgi:predicted nucleic acid-binding protein
MKLVFADSFFFFALVNSRDSAHRRAIEFLRLYQGRILTTGWVMTELGDGLSSTGNRPAFLATVDKLRSNSRFTVEEFSDGLYEKGIELYRNRLDKEWSLTDCISFVVMSQESISEALTGDHHFEQAGFNALLK